METYRTLEDLPRSLGPLVATIGNFDGVHCGHRWVLARVMARAKELGLRSAVITFDPHPARALRPEERRLLITPTPRKLELLAETGVEAAVVLPFSDSLARMTALEFARDVLRDRLQVAELHEGENFRFGRGAAADLQTLTDLGEVLGFRVNGYAPEQMRGGVVSSTRVRELIEAGEVTQAWRLLGRSFSVDSTPAAGRGYGTRYAVPTINLAPYPELLPGHGVYVTRLEIGRGDGARSFDGVTNVGNRPTFGVDSFAVESFLFDFEAMELTEQTPLRLEFLYRLRAERRWPDAEALKAQIGRDVGRAKQFLRLRERVAGDARRRFAAPGRRA